MQAYIPLAVGIAMIAAGVFNFTYLTQIRGLRWLEGIFGDKGPRIGAGILGVAICAGYFFM
jgi:hypothetical protein